MKIYNEIESFLYHCRSLDLCSMYNDKIDGASERSELIKLASDINGLPYFLKAIYEHRGGITDDFVLKYYKFYANTDKPIEQDGYDSKVFLCTKGNITINATVYGIYKSTFTVKVPKYCVCHLFDVDSDIKIDLQGEVYYHKLLNGKWIDKIITIKDMKYFTIKELTESETAKEKKIENIPNFEQTQNLIALVEKVLDPIREDYGKPIEVTSGFRCPLLNKEVGGVPTSQHPKGEAADITIGTKESNKTLFNRIKELNLPLCQCILEKGGRWIHISYDRNNPKRQYLKL